MFRFFHDFLFGLDRAKGLLFTTHIFAHPHRCGTSNPLWLALRRTQGIGVMLWRGDDGLPTRATDARDNPIPDGKGSWN